MDSKKTSIAWIDLTFKIHSLLERKEKTILNKVSGFAEFGTLTAVMGPSGAGLTSLLKCLNGMNESNLSRETVIRLSPTQKIRSSFVGHNEKDFLIMHLTAKQNMIYASKLKNSNCGESVDHQKNINQIMTDLLIHNTMNTRAENCSGGEQKRLAIALELTAINKPNLIFCDEPTTGLDSNVAEILVQSLKDLSLNKNISIVATIHQPSSDILQMIDKLYVLAKGGICVYFGTPQYLSTHLKKVELICNAYQVPIEFLITIASKGTQDKTNFRLNNETLKCLKETEEKVLNETIHKSIKRKNKSFSLGDVYILMCRTITEILVYDWRNYLLRFITIFLFNYIITLIYEKDIGKYNDCFTLDAVENRSCLESTILVQKIDYNRFMLSFIIWINQCIQCIFTVKSVGQKFKTFNNEHQNRWYSSGTFFIVQNINDLISSTFITFGCSSFIFFKTRQLNESKRFWAFSYTNLLSFLTVDSFVYLTVFMIPQIELSMIIDFAFFMTSMLFSGFMVKLQDMGSLLRFISNFTSCKFILNAMIVSIYGFGRCTQNQFSKTLIEYELNEQLFTEYTLYVWTQIFVFRLLSFIVLLSIKNPKVFNYFKSKFFSQTKGNELVLKPELELINKPNNCYYNEIAVDLEEINIYSESDSSDYCSVYENDIQLYEEIDLKNRLSIAWIDLTLKVDKTFYSKEKLILRGIRGFVHFGTMTALMGPSGAGKTSLLRCLNGMYRNLMTEDSKIFLNKYQKIRTCFIEQNQRQHILRGLNVKQSILYASKLKNTGKQMDHQLNAQTLMEELAIHDIQEVNIEKCSSGQQKRVVMAMEMTPKVKPNLICVDEPTSGVDSYSSLLMINCFKRLSQKHNLSIITSIHQPNIEVIMKFDKLYILAKGGVTIFYGRPHKLRNHLEVCEVNCHENQIPIEVLMKVASNDFNDENVIRLSEKTNHYLKTFERRVYSELKLSPKGIPQRIKRFSFKETKYLLFRFILYTLRFNWIIIMVSMVSILGSTLALRLLYDGLGIEKPKGCIDVLTNMSGCYRDMKTLREATLYNYNVSYLSLAINLPCLIVVIFTGFTFVSESKLFKCELRNYWYSVESYYLSKIIVEMIYSIPLIVGIVLILDIYEKDGISEHLSLALMLTFIVAQSTGHLIGICMEERPTLGVVIIIVYYMIFNDALMPTKDFSKLFRKIRFLDVCNWNTKYNLVYFYRNACNEYQINTVFLITQSTSDDYYMSRNVMIINVIIFQMLSFLALKTRVNLPLIWIRVKKFNKMLTFKRIT